MALQGVEVENFEDVVFDPEKEMIFADSGEIKTLSITSEKSQLYAAKIVKSPDNGTIKIEDRPLHRLFSGVPVSNRYQTEGNFDADTHLKIYVIPFDESKVSGFIFSATFASLRKWASFVGW